MFILRKYNNLLEKIRFADLLPYLSYIDDIGAFYLDYNAIGFVWKCQPIRGIGPDTVKLLQTIYSNKNFPENTVIQFQIFFNPFIHDKIERIAEIRKNIPDRILKKIFENKADFFKQGIRNVMLKDIQLYVSLTIPLNKNFTQTQYELLKDHVEKNLKVMGLFPRLLNPEGLIRYLSNILNISFSYEKQITDYDPKIFIKDQIIRNENSYEITKDGIILNNDIEIKTLTFKQYPEEFYLYEMDTLLGDFFNDFRVINSPYMITLSVVFVDSEKIKKNFLKKYSALNYQIIGPMAHFVPKLKFKKENYDIFYSEIENKNRTIVKGSLVVTVFEHKDNIGEVCSMLEGLYRTKNFVLNVDEYITLPVFLSTLPLNFDIISMEKFRKLITLTDYNVSHLTPVLADWKGTGNPVLNFVSRRGQLIQFDIFDAPGGKNGCIIAKTGSGKSFFANEVIVSYLSLGAKVYVIDAGRSYEKLCSMLDGEFIVFSDKSNICINPFTTIKNIQDDMELLKVIVEVMAANEGKLDSLQQSFIEEAINECYEKYSNNFGINELVEILKNSEDQRKKDIGQMLFTYTNQGSLGKWVNGQNNLKFHKNLIVLELDELKSMKNLQSVVLTSIITLIEREVYLGDRNIPKLIIIDEAWELLANPNVARFIEAAYRRFRKYSSAIFVITQGVNDLYKNEYTKALFENSDFLFLLAQKAESIEMIKKEKKINLSDYEFEILKTIKTVHGVYSEIFLYSSIGREVLRLYVDRFTQLVYTTDPDEVNKINSYREKGYNIIDAINNVIEEERKKFAGINHA